MVPLLENLKIVLLLPLGIGAEKTGACVFKKPELVPLSVVPNKAKHEM